MPRPKKRSAAQRAASIQNLQRARAARKLLSQKTLPGIKVKGRPGESWSRSTHRPRFEVKRKSLLRGGGGPTMIHVKTEMGRYEVFQGKAFYSPKVGTVAKGIGGQKASNRAAMAVVRKHVENLRGKRLKKYGA